MSTREESRKSDYIFSTDSNTEMARLIYQDQILSGTMGLLPQGLQLREGGRILDVACGPAGWARALALQYPAVQVVGVDISQTMLDYAHASSQAQHFPNISFQLMDITTPWPLADASFDLVNLRFGGSFLLVKDWPRLLGELLRVTRPGGIVRVTDLETTQGTSSAGNRIFQMSLCALYRSGHSLTEEKMGVTHELPHLLSESGCQQVQTKAHTLEFIAGTVGGQNTYEIARFGFQTLLPFLQKTGCASEDYDALCEQAMIEMQQPDFRVTWEILTAWGTKPA